MNVLLNQLVNILKYIIYYYYISHNEIKSLNFIL